jgi:hypothetical protein
VTCSTPRISFENCFGGGGALGLNGSYGDDRMAGSGRIDGSLDRRSKSRVWRFAGLAAGQHADLLSAARGTHGAGGDLAPWSAEPAPPAAVG